MIVEISCPQCATSYAVRRNLLGKRSKCAKCGAAFVLTEPAKDAASPSPEPLPQPSTPEFVPAPQIAVQPRATSEFRMPIAHREENKPPASSYWALRMIARSFDVFAVISAVSSLIPLVLLIHGAVQWPNLILLTLVRYGLPFIVLLLWAVMYLFLAQLIRLMLQLEQNTRESAEACRRLAEHLCAIETDA